MSIKKPENFSGFLLYDFRVFFVFVGGFAVATFSVAGVPYSQFVMTEDSFISPALLAM